MKKTANILFASDLYLSKEIEKEYVKSGGNNIYTDLLKVFDSVDFRVVNLESPLTNSNSPIQKTGPNMKASPSMINLLKDGRFDLVNLANNHILDYGEKGLLETIDVCNSAGIKTVGAGKNLKDASKIFSVKINEISVSIINVCEQEYQIADNNSAGANPFNFYNTSQQIKVAKEQNDVVIVVYHGGNEHYNLPSPRLQKTFRFIADMGADAVVGHHTHCNSGIENYAGKPLFYSLGNFLFYDKTDFESWFYGFMVSLKINDKGVLDFTIYPYQQCKEEIKIKLLNGDKLLNFNENLEKLNRIVCDEDAVEKEWLEYTNKYRYNMLYNFYPPSKSISFILRVMKKLFGYRPLRKTTLAQFNIVRNEAHHELLVSILKNYHKKNLT